jgi:signal transduction histidine kinase
LIGFALFIVACGSTHLLEVITTWVPAFWIDAWTNIITAALSAYVAISLILRIKRIAFGINDYADRLSNTELENLRMQDSLLASQKIEEWSRMSATVSHEIKNPLEAIQSLQYLICSSPGVSLEIVGLARSTSAEAARLLTIAESALSFIRQAKNPELVDLCAAMDSVTFLLDSVVREKDIKLTVEHTGDCVVEAFAGETRQVLLNLVRNACEAITGPGNRVSVRLTGQKQGVEVIVEDEGCGIDPEFLPTLFQFGASTKGEKGNGMGLWTVKHLLDRHHATIAVQSVPDTGTRFDLWWPRKFTGSTIRVPG